MINITKIKKLDPQNVYSSIKYLPKQIEQAIKEVRNINFPEKYKAVTKKADVIAISGMGGSIYNYYVISSLFSDQLEKPLVMINGYQTPKVAQKKTLFIGSSYSGSTEETIATTEEAIKNKNYVTAVTAGSKLGELMKKNHLPFYQFDPQFNPCGQPRVGLGYTIFGPLLILDKLGYLKLNLSVLNKSLQVLKNSDEKLQKKASQLKDEIKNKVVIFAGAEHLAANAHIARNQFNETAKAFADYHLIPELNHHLMEGLTYPKDKNLIFVFYNSKFYFERNKKRITVTKKVLDEQNVPYLELSFAAENKMEEFLLHLQFGSYLSFFLGIDYDVNPSLIPWVDYFKNELGKSSGL